MRLGQLTTEKSECPNIARARADFMLNQRKCRNSPRTLEYYEFCHRNFETWLKDQEITDVLNVTANHLRRFTLDLEERMKPNSVHAIMRGVRALFRFLEAEELIARNPMLKLKMPKLDKTIMPAFTPEEIHRLEKATEGKDPTAIRDLALILFPLNSGLRLSECASLKVGDVNLETGIMNVMGKGRKERVSKLGAVGLKAFTKYARTRCGEILTLRSIRRLSRPPTVQVDPNEND